MIILIILIIVLLLSFTYIKNLFKNDITILDEVKLKKSEPSNNGFALMLEQDDGTYKESNESTWPTDMVFNSELSGCIDINGNVIEDSLSFDSTNNIVNLRVTGTVYCYVYFDTKKPAVILTVSTDGVSNTLPTYNHYKQTLTCDDGTSSYFNVKYQRLEISNVGNTNTNCNLNYTKDTNTYTLLSDKVRSVGTEITSTNNAGNTDISYRYTGKEPDNYVWFNNEMWRIIGLIPVCLESECGTPDTSLVKIIRSQSIGTLRYDQDSERGWVGSTLSRLLNNYYYGKKDATSDSVCRKNSSSYAYPICNYNVIGISDNSNDYYGRMVNDVYIYTGGESIGTIDQAYEYETESISSKNYKIGVMYESDYGYATSGIKYTKKITEMNNYIKNNWLYGQGGEWVIDEGYVHIYKDGSVGDGGSTAADLNVRPTLYLDSSVYIISGDGTESNPYILGM